MKIIQHIFFDLDRTLWDFEKNSKISLQQVYEEFNIKKVTSFNRFNATYSRVNNRYWRDYSQGKINKEILRNNRFTATLKKFKIDNHTQGQEMADRYISISPHQKNLIPGAMETIDKLKTDGYQLHIITNGFKETQYLKLKSSGIFPFVNTIVCSDEVGISKPHPKVYQEALARANAQPHNSIMVGDDLNGDVIGPEKLGITGVLYDPKNTMNSPSILTIRQLEEFIELVENLS